MLQQVLTTLRQKNVRVYNYFNLAVRHGYVTSVRSFSTSTTSATTCIAKTRRPVALALLHLCRASGRAVFTAQLLVSRSYCLSSYARSLRHAL
jgi:hypothetical protein